MMLLMEDIGGVVYNTNIDNLRKSPDGGNTLQPLTESDLSEFCGGNILESVQDQLGNETFAPKANCFLTESRGSDGFLYIVGPMARCDAKNGNGRVYERGIWESVKGNKNIIERFNGGGSKGHLEHPKDGKTDLNLISHVMVPYTKDGIFNIAEDGLVHGKARILNTTAGKQLQELYRGGVAVGFSSRGKGSTFRRGTVDHVAKDYMYDTHDAVASPSVSEAMPKLEEKNSSNHSSTLASSQHESIQLTTEASSMGNVKDILKQLEGNLRELAGGLDESNDAISLAAIREGLLDQQMAIRSLVESDPTSRDVAEDLATAAKELRAATTAKMEALKDATIEESVKGSLEESGDNAGQSDLREILRETKERLDYYRTACEELAESDEIVTRKEYEASLALSEGLLKKCKEFQAHNEELTEAYQEVTEQASLTEEVGSHPDYQLLEQRYEKALLIIEELTGRIRGAQVADRVEEVIKIEPRFARIRDDLLECETVDEVNSRISRLERLFVESDDSALSENDVLAILSEGFADSETPVAPEQEMNEGRVDAQPQRAPLSSSQAHRMSLIHSICGTTSFRK
jgi:hypothetical protein